MARNAHPEVTRQRILDAARAQFAAKGFEKTSIQDILNALGDLSKGAIYHHFASKEAILDALSNQDMEFTENIFARLDSDKTMSGLQKLQETMRSTMRDKQHLTAIRALPPQLDDPTTPAANLRHWGNELSQQLLVYIEEGVADGSTPTQYPREAAQMLALLPNYWLIPHFFPGTPSELRHRIECLEAMLEAINVPVFDDALIDDFMSGIAVLAAPGNESPAETPQIAIEQ